MATDLDPDTRSAAAGGRPRATTDSPPDAQRQRVAAVLVPLLLVAVTATLRLYLLDTPERIYFDETYYASDAVTLVDQGVEDGFVVHPQVGKWVIGAGVALLGDGPLGWRAPAAVMGTATVLLTYLAGLRLFRRRGLAALAGLLVAVDGLAFTMSRIAMLDATLAFFVVLGFWLLLIDRDRQWRALPTHTAPDPETDADRATATALPRRGHAFRWLAGLAFGLALATKWSALLPIGAAGLFVLGSDLAFRRRTTGRLLIAWPRIVASGVATLVLLPAMVYLVGYASWFANYQLTRPGQERCEQGGPAVACDFAPTVMLSDWFGEQREIARFHADLETEHQYRATAWTWPLMLRPVAYYYENCTPETQERRAEEGETCEVAPGNVAEILGMGNPLLWWMALAAYPVLLLGLAWRRDWAAAAIAVFLLGQYVPWLFASRPVFLFYVTPIVPFIALAVAWAAGCAQRYRPLRWVPAAVALVAVSGFVYWYPVLVGMEISDEAWRLRMWSDRWI
ncbi:phospholipid carrier-dependent glycosyltransferase [soil metagenome]